MRTQRFGALVAAAPGGRAKAYLRWIDATTRRPDVRAARIAEVVDLLAVGVKERPKS